MYDKIEEIENQLIAARAKKQSIEAEKLTSDNIYKVLIYFEKLYVVMNEAEKRQLIEALDFYGIKHAERNTRISKKNPVPHEFSILTVHTNSGYTHWTLLYDGKYYDPEFGLVEGEYTYGKITSFLGIYK